MLCSVPGSGEVPSIVEKRDIGRGGGLSLHTSVARAHRQMFREIREGFLEEGKGDLYPR